MRNTILTTLFLIFSTSTWSVEIDCSLNTTPIVGRVRLDNAPNYFISADPDGKYTAVIDSSQSNILVNMEDGSSQTVPGSVDPVFTPDGKFLTLPGGKFYAMDEISEKVDNGQPARGVSSSFNSGQGGVYQSIGILPGSTDSKKTYRYMDDQAGASYFDVEMKFDSSGKVISSKRKTSSKRLCTEASSRDTPMMSKDGKYLSILNFETHTTQIWRVNDNGTCNMMVDIGVPTGKVDFGFAPGAPQITFHVDEVGNDWKYFSGFSTGMRKSVYVMNLDINGSGDEESWSVRDMAKVVSPDTENGLGKGSYYPRFRKDGKIVAVTQVREGDDADYYLDVVGVNSLNYQPFNPEITSGRVTLDPDCKSENTTMFQAQIALGLLWAQTCTNYSDRLRNVDLNLIPLGMNRAACLEMVDKKWGSVELDVEGRNRRLQQRYSNEMQTDWVDPRVVSNDDIMRLSVDELKAACPQANTSNTLAAEVEVIGGEGNSHGPLSVEGVVSRRCIGCHESRNVSLNEDGTVIRSDTNGPFIDFANINTAEDAMVWRQRVFNPQPRSSAMPPPDDLDGDGNISEEEYQSSLRENFTEQELNTLQEKLLEIESGQRQWNWGE